MHYRLAIAALLLPLAGCVVPPPEPAAYPYPQPGYPPPQPPYGQQDLSYPGYAYNDGSPTLVVEGVTWPLIFYGGGWGYWDGYHHWHGAPGRVGNWLSMRHPGGVGYRPYGGGPYGRPVGFRGGPGGYGPGGFHPGFGGGARAGAPRAGGGGARPAPQRHREEGHR